MRERILLKKDKYRNARGSYSRLYNISCRKCGRSLALYQKDGPGIIKRLYFDRIFGPLEIVGLEKQMLTEVKNFRCANCAKIIGVPYIYEKENRKAFLLEINSIVKKVVSTKNAEI